LVRAQIAFRAEEPEAALADLQSTLNLLDELGFDQFVVVEGRRLPELLRYALEQGLGLGILPQILVRIETHQASIAARPEPVVQAETAPTLRIRALGPPQVELDGEQIQWATTQSRDLFFCLLQHPQGLRKEELGAIFWPDHPPHKLDGIFRSTLYRLRRAVFRECVVYEDSMYRVSRESNYSFDVEDFERLLDLAAQAASPDQASVVLEEALTLYTGDYLENVYADWCSLERERLREHQLNALETLARLHAGQGRLNRAIKEYQQLINQDPYREPAHRELMRCYYRLGDRATAVRQYQSCAQVLREDLGLSPSPETEALYLQIIG
jgi:DNA-binding SARP family transcriptional activator